MTEAVGPGSHAEGASSHSAGEYSHAEGNSAISYGKGSHAEGYSYHKLQKNGTNSLSTISPSEYKSL